MRTGRNDFGLDSEWIETVKGETRKMQQAAKRKSVLQKLFNGFLVGIAFLVPGISGGALAATLGIFESAISALSNIRRHPMASIRFLLPIVIGGAVGAFFAGVVLVRLLTIAESQTVCLFLGMLAGTMPKLWRDAHQDFPGPRYWWLMLAGLAVTGVLFVLDRTAVASPQPQEVGLLIAALGGGIFGAGALIPGISGSFFLIYLGWYRPLIEAIIGLNIPITIVTVLGFAAVILLLVRVANHLFERHRRATMSVILGFVGGSLALVLPKDFFTNALFLNIQLIMAGFGIGLLLGMMDND